ncbi:hypothetical protein K6119_10635 [Paracrocinitomix mangrovi]|uniref:hypothetical protein n=1 Tax=Paracrocinitomix mangrovi TaxID=2862509 RepID=UPI001C8E9B61|nr:hypothetical protein [Paracrocinitomix mangrovi]UKN00188.1 hypothetical protein K6119_10635 [Paracrocinitomix mangrovi]
MNNSIKKFDVFLLFAWICIILGLLAIALYTYQLFSQNLANTEENISIELFGSYGDFVGGFVGTIWSLAAVILVYKTYSLQKKELNDLKKKGSHEIFQSNFYSLLELNERAKLNWEYAGKYGSDAFQEFRSVLKTILESKSSDFEKAEKIVFELSKGTDGFTQFPIHLIFETVYLIDEQDENLKSRYYRIFGSTFSTNEKIHLWCMIYSGFLLKKEIPANLEKVLWLTDAWKVWIKSGDTYTFNPNARV